MAIVKVPQSARLTVKIQTGLNDAGNPVFRSRNFANLKPDAADADVYSVGAGIAALQLHPVASILKLDEISLVDQ